MKARSTGRYKEGFSTLEILIAFAILILCIGAVIMVVFGNQSVAVDTETNSEAIYKAQSLLEKARADSRFDFNLVNSDTLTETSGPLLFTKELAVRSVDFFTKQVTSTVSWLSGGRLLSIFFTTLLTNPDAIDGGNTCSSILSGDWTNPQLLGNVDVGENNGATDVDVFMEKAYLTINPVASPKDDFYIIDVSDSFATPLPIITSTSTGPGLEAVHISNKYAYLANRSINGQLQIIDTRTIPLQLMANFKISAVTGNGAYGKSIFYKDDFVYLGLYNTDTGPEFNIIDVSNPSKPVWKGGYSIGHEINAIYVRDDFAYLASPDNRELMVLNISNPVNPTLAGNLNLPDNSANGKSIALVGDTFFLGRTEGASPSTKEFQLVNITDPSNPVALGSSDVNSTINALAIRDNLAFMVTNESNLEFQIWNLDNMTLYGSENVEQTLAGGMDCEGNFIYIAQRSNNALQIVGPGP